MAKYERTLNTNIDEVLTTIEEGILNGSFSASIEEQSDFTEGNARCSVRLFERYSAIGGNRLSLSVTLFQVGDGKVHLSASSTGGSTALLFKINTWGEEAFVSECKRVIENKCGSEE